MVPVDTIQIPPTTGGTWWTYRKVRVPFMEILKRLITGDRLSQEYLQGKRRQKLPCAWGRVCGTSGCYDCPDWRVALLGYIAIGIMTFCFIGFMRLPL